MKFVNPNFGSRGNDRKMFDKLWEILQAGQSLANFTGNKDFQIT